MVKIRLKFLAEDVDRHGNVRCYVRIPGRAKVRLRSMPGSEAFMREYGEAVASSTSKPQARAMARGSFGYLCRLYFASATFKRLDVSTQSWRRRALDNICELNAEKPVAMMQPRHIRKLRDEKANQPSVANQRLKALKALFVWATEEDEAPHNPTLGVKKIKYATNGHHTWTVDEIEQYKARHPLGTKARLAFDILRFTTGRREDAPRLGPQHVRNGRVKFRQAKNEHRNPTDINIPLHPNLAASIAATPSGHLKFLVTEYGKPYTANGFGGAMRDWCNQANLRHCSAHGLRKSTPTQMAEDGATGHEIASVLGHKNLEEVETYTRMAQKAVLADSAMAKWRE